MIGLILTIGVVSVTILAGILLNGEKKNALRVFKTIFSLSVAVLFLAVLLTPASAFAQTTDRGEVNGNAMIGVALSTGLAALGAGIAVGLTGAAAIGAVSEDPRMLGRSLIFVGLAEGIAIYGLVISIMIFGRV